MLHPTNKSLGCLLWPGVGLGGAHRGLGVGGELVELPVEGDGGVVRSEHLGGEPCGEAAFFSACEAQRANAVGGREDCWDDRMGGIPVCSICPQAPVLPDAWQ